MPEVFVSWSGPRSKIVADAIHASLPLAIQSVKKVFLSSKMPKGIRWGEMLATELASTDFGIVCLTRENMAAPWLNFEAGALSKHVDITRVMTILIGVEHTQVTGPLSHFNHTATTHDDMHRLMTTINDALGDDRLDDSVLDRAFEFFWNEIEPALEAAEAFEDKGVPQLRSVEDMVEELLGLARSQAALAAEGRSTGLSELPTTVRVADAPFSGSDRPPFRWLISSKSEGSLISYTLSLPADAKKEVNRRIAQGATLEDLFGHAPAFPRDPVTLALQNADQDTTMPWRVRLVNRRNKITPA